MKKLYNIDNFTSAVFYIAILLFIIGFNFTDAPPPSGWYQQFMPNLGGKPISDLFFIDSLTGWSVTYTGVAFDSAYILKTINGGDNWNIIYFDKNNFTKIKFINQNTGYTSGVTPYIGASCINKSTNGGLNWFAVPPPDPFFTVDDISILNEDTIWVAVSSSTSGGVFRTTNGGQNWTQQLYLVSNNPNKIYMFNRNIGFICTTAGWIYKTTNSGINWTLIYTVEGFTDMYFSDSLKGWKVEAYVQDSIKVTTNGGINWTIQILPHGGSFTFMSKIAGLNKDSLWGVGGYLYNGRGMIYKTTNGGTNWGYQAPDTTTYYHCKFINRLNGWAYGASRGIHTVTGGDTTFYYGIQKISSEVPKDFILKQNYPNPFNPRTVIPYSLKSAGYMRIIAYDILGREVQRMVDQKQNAGEYEVDFMGKFTATGVYFYRMTVDGNVIGTRTMVLLK
ncbi:MAG: T9SS type A sorting domain-containing protein [Ignavibacteria bacterium]